MSVCKVCPTVLGNKNKHGYCQEHRGPVRKMYDIPRKEYFKEYRQRETSKVAAREAKLKSKYGMTLADYEAILHNQNGLCAICRLPPTRVSLVVDHCHTTGKVRGLLCATCNQGLGLLKDNTSNLLRAVSYLVDQLEDDSQS